MAIYRIDITVFIKDVEDVKKIYQYLKKFRDKYNTVNKGKINVEYSVLRLHKCYHDESPTKPCEIIDEWRSD